MRPLRVDNKGLKSPFDNVRALITNTHNLFNVLFVFTLSNVRTVHTKNNLFAFFLPLRKVAPELFNDKQVRLEMLSVFSEFKKGFKDATYSQVLSLLADRIGFKVLLDNSKLEIELLRNDEKALKYVDILLTKFLSDVYKKYLLLKERTIREEDVINLKIYLTYVIDFSHWFYFTFGEEYDTAFKNSFLVFLKGIRYDNFYEYLKPDSKISKLGESRQVNEESPNKLLRPLFHDYFIKYKLELPELLRKELKPLGLKGLNIRAIINELLKREILLIPYRGNSLFFSSMEEFFGFYIGSYSGVFDVEPSRETEEFAVQFIDSLIDEFKDIE